jgi:hypothetical protein
MRAEFFLAGMKAQWDEGGGWILLGDNTGGGSTLNPSIYPVSSIVAVQGYIDFTEQAIFEVGKVLKDFPTGYKVLLRSDIPSRQGSRLQCLLLLSLSGQIRNY